MIDFLHRILCEVADIANECSDRDAQRRLDDLRLAANDAFCLVDEPGMFPVDAVSGYVPV